MIRGQPYGLVATGGVVGATIRWAVGEIVDTGSFPWATFIVNVVGAALLAWIGSSRFTPGVSAALGTGVCGGLTTFSTFSLEVVTLADDGRASLAALYLGSSILAAVVAFTIVKRTLEVAR